MIIFYVIESLEHGRKIVIVKKYIHLIKSSKYKKKTSLIKKDINCISLLCVRELDYLIFLIFILCIY